MVSLLTKPKAGVAVLLLGVDVAFFSAFTPTTASSSVIVTGCLLLAATIYTIARGVNVALSGLGILSVTSTKRLAVYAAVLGTFLLLMQSIGQLSWRDALAVVPLIALFYGYILYWSRPNPNRQAREGY